MSNALKLINTHPYGFRHGEAAEVIGTKLFAPNGHLPRMCYVVRYGDGVEDLVSMDDCEHFELYGEQQEAT